LKGNVLSFASYEILANFKNEVNDVDTIIDIGANNGQFLKAARHFFPKAFISSFEPIPKLFNKLNNIKSPNIAVFNIAVGNSTGEFDFQLNSYSHVSSFLNISKENETYPQDHIETIRVKQDTLDNLSKSLVINGATLLKLDIQGFEMEALKGGANTIKAHVNYIIIEANFVKLYENQPTFTELNRYLNELGFELKTMLDFNFGKDKSYIEADFLYHKV
jgi:FkbM family methyltransferase